MTVPPLFPAVACVQFPIVLGEVEENIRQAEHLIAAHAPAPESLLLLPEMWATGFDYQRTAALGQRTPEILAAMQRLAAALILSPKLRNTDIEIGLVRRGGKGV